MMVALGLRHFTPPAGDTSFKGGWTTMERAARYAQYIPAVLFGRVVQISTDGKEVEQLNPSRVKILLPLTVLAGAAIYLGLQKVALIAAVIMVTASIVSVVVMGRSEAQGLFNDIYVNHIVQQRTAGVRTDKAKLADEVNKYAAQIANAANVNGWFSGDIAAALAAFQKQCEGGTTKLVQYLLRVEDDAVFEAVYKRAGDFLMQSMTSREMATAVMAEVVKATPRAEDEKQVERFQRFIERFARRGEELSGANWTSEICDAVKGNPVALAGVLTGLTAKEGSIAKAMARGFTASVLREVIDNGRLPISTLGALAVELEQKAGDPKFAGYGNLQERCEARLSDAINRLRHASDTESELSPQTVAFNQLKDRKVQTKWIQVSLGGSWLGELAANINLGVAVQGLSGDLARVDNQFLTIVLERLLKEGTKAQAELVVNLANTSTLQTWGMGIGQALSDVQIALIQMLRVKHNLEAPNVDLAIDTNPAKYVPALLERSQASEKEMIWKTFAGKGVYPLPRSLSDENANAFFGHLPGAFKAAVNKMPANHEVTIQRLTSALEFLHKQSNANATQAFVGALDDGQKAILGHHLTAEENSGSELANYFGADTLSEWKALGSVGHGTLYNGYVE